MCLGLGSQSTSKWEGGRERRGKKREREKKTKREEKRIIKVGVGVAGGRGAAVVVAWGLPLGVV